MDMEGDNADGEEETNLREGEDKKRTGGKRNITIKMLAKREEDYEDKTFRGRKRGRYFESNEDNQEVGKGSDEDDKKKGCGEEHENDYEELGSSH